MYIRFFQRLCFALATITLSASMMQAQTFSGFWIIVKNDLSLFNTGTLFFGNHINATYGMDTLDPTWFEREVPGGLSPGFEAYWHSIPGRVNTWGQGLFPYDFRGIPSNIAKLDTFVLSFSDVYYDTCIFTFRWPTRGYLAQRCDSMFLVDPTGQIPKINMFDADSLSIKVEWVGGINKFRIYKYGYYIIDAAENPQSDVPSQIVLHQNYPNPFNPATTIEYQLPFTSRVKIKVYNLLGQTMSTLTDETQQAGFKSVTWNANGISSGVYFYKLDAVSVSDPSKMFTQVKKMVLVR